MASPNHSPEALQQKAEQLYHAKGKEKQAIDAYVAYLAIVPDDAAGWSALGALYTTCDAITDALQSFQRAIDLEPTSAHTWMQKAMVLSNLNRSQNPSFSNLQHLKDTYRDHFADLNALRLALLDCYEHVIALTQDKPTLDTKSAMVERARILSQLQRHHKAIKAYEQLLLIEKSPRRRLHSHLAIALQYEALEEWDASLIAVEQCLESGDIFLLTHKARILRKAGDDAGAESTYDAYFAAVDDKLAHKPEPAYYFQKASVLEDLGRFHEAKASLNNLQESGLKLTSSMQTSLQERLRRLDEHT